MDVELLVDENGNIVAAVESRAVRLPGDSGITLRPTMRACPGQVRHVLTMPAELAQLGLKAALRSCRFVHDAAGPRLEKRNT